jgi:hypothetical protein
MLSDRLPPTTMSWRGPMTSAKRRKIDATPNQADGAPGPSQLGTGDITDIGKRIISIPLIREPMGICGLALSGAMFQRKKCWSGVRESNPCHQVGSLRPKPLDQPRNVVYPLRFELRSAANRAAVLATGRQVQNWCSGRDSNPRFLVCRTRALAARRPKQTWCACEESNLDLNLRRVAP